MKFPIIQDNLFSDEECGLIYSDAINRKDELSDNYSFHKKTLDECLQSNDFISKCIVFASQYFDLSSMVGCEVWYNYNIPPNIKSHDWHQDKDEVLYSETGKLVFPLCTIIYYPFIESSNGGELFFRNYNIDKVNPKTNRIVCFESHAEHKTEICHYKRISIAICPWNYKIKKFIPSLNQKKRNIMKLIKRECGDCTECCQGWLSGSAYGKTFYPGKPCHFVGEKGCTIYKHRPNDPCVAFRCGWLDDPDTFPEWLKPNLSKVLARRTKTKNGIDFYKIFECGQKIDSSVLNYLILYGLEKNINLSIQVDGGWSSYGTREFLEDFFEGANS